MTNGEKLIEIFPNNRHITLKRTTQFAINPMTINQQMIVVDNDFWDAEYKEPTPKNDLEVDCISRADVLHILLDYDYANENALVLKDIKALPSVIPQTRKGKWITYLSTAIEDFYQCSECGRMVHIKQTDSIRNYPYCHCGAKMAETEET